MFHVFFEEGARIFQEFFKGIKNKVSKVFKRSFKVVSGCFKVVSRWFKQFPGNLKRFLIFSKALTWCFRKLDFLVF